MIEAMSQVELDLKAGRYQNALRQRPVLIEKMGNVKQYLEGEFEVTPRRHLEPARRNPERNSRLDARPLAARLGGVESAVF